VLLQETLPEPSVQLILVRVRDTVETQMDNLVSEGGDGKVEAAPLLLDVLGPEPRLQVVEPFGGVASPERLRAAIFSDALLRLL
jgi:hypothetical protein